MVTRREVLRRGAGTAAALAAGPLLASCGGGSVPATAASSAAAATAVPTLPPPETTTIKLAADACDIPMYAAERYLREEGFTDIQFTDQLGNGAIATGGAHIARGFPTQFFLGVQSGTPKVIALGGLHPGCVEIWAQPGIASLKDLRGRSVTVAAKTLANTPYSYMAMVLKQAGVDPKDVNWVVQADANPVRLFIDGKTDAVFAAADADAALGHNPANKGHVIHSQAMEEPWKSTNCCFILVSEPWYRANPIAAKRALRAIYRTADALPADRSDAAKAATDKGLYGGAASFANVRDAANMVPVDWRSYDPEKAVRFYAPLLSDVGVLTTSADDLLKALDLRIYKELVTELKK
jgi:NitT/TauT family transport system substrate-binding protein